MKESVVEEILKVAGMLKFDLYGIRGRETGKFIMIGFIGDELIYGMPPHPSGANLWRSLSDAEAVYGILAQDGNFAEGHFVDKAFSLKFTLLNFNYVL